MKNLVALFALIMLQVSLAEAQSNLIYNENFSGTIKNISTTNLSWRLSTAWPNTVANTSGGNYMQTSKQNTTTALFLSNVSTNGYHNIQLTWNASRNKNNTAIALAYSLDAGKTFTAVTNFTDVSPNSNWETVNSGKAINLPNQTADQDQLMLRWVFQTDQNSEYNLDDILLTGTPNDEIATLNWNSRPNNEDPFVVSAPGSIAPYSANGVTLRMTKETANGVNLTTALLSNTTFQSPARMLTLIQNKATATAGTRVTTTFSKAVSDLSFTLVDVDRAAGQNRDVIKVEGFLNGTPVSLEKSNVITTTFNEFVENTGTIRAFATGTDASSSSNNADVRVKFSNLVDKLVLTYTNTETAGGSQGIAISSFNWRSTITPLPVSLTSFSGKIANNQTNLIWATASEKNNDKFVVERSLDGRKFESIGTVKGNGTTAAAQQYSFTDNRPAQGTNYYRLKQVDFDGTSEYSKIVMVKNTAMQTELTIYPVPATSEINVLLTESAGMETLKIYNLAGNLVKQVNLNGENNLQLTLPVNELPAGYYLVQVSGAQNTITKKIVKQ